MRIVDVTKRFSLISSLSNKEAIKYKFLCDDAISYIRSILREDVIEEDNSIILTRAAAAYAYYLYSIYEVNDDLSSLKIGEIAYTISQNNLKEKAISLWKIEKNNIAHLTVAQDFLFRRVN